MIKNNKEYEKMKAQLLGWQKTLEQMKSALTPSDYTIYLEAHTPMIIELENALKEYDSLQSEIEHPAYFLNPLEVGRRLVQTRIRSGWTQEKLASRIRTTQAQVSRSEDDEYSSAPLMRLYEIASVLGLKLITLLVPAGEVGYFTMGLRNLFFEYFSSGYQATITPTSQNFSIPQNTTIQNPFPFHRSPESYVETGA